MSQVSRKRKSHTVAEVKRTRTRVGSGQMVARMPRVRKHEIKYVDVALTVLAVLNSATPPVAQLLNALLPGTQPYQRDGTKVANKSLYIRGNLEPTATWQPDTIRVIVVYDRQTNKALPAYSDLVQSITAAGAVASTGLDGINMANRERFKVLRDTQIYVGTGTYTAGVVTNVYQPDTSGPKDMFNYKEFIPLRDLETHYAPTSAGTVADITTGGLFLFAVATNQDSKFSFQFTSRLRYDDL